MTARNELTPTRPRRTVVRAPMQDRFPDPSTDPAKAGVPSSKGLSRWRPTLVPERATKPFPRTPGNRAVILSP